MEFLKQTNSDPITNLNDLFPETVLLCHVTDSWKCLVEFEDTVNKAKNRWLIIIIITTDSYWLFMYKLI